jgi:hypothetical protein
MSLPNPGLGDVLETAPLVWSRRGRHDTEALVACRSLGNRHGPANRGGSVRWVKSPAGSTLPYSHRTPVRGFERCRGVRRIGDRATVAGATAPHPRPLTRLATVHQACTTVRCSPMRTVPRPLGTSLAEARSLPRLGPVPVCPRPAGGRPWRCCGVRTKRPGAAMPNPAGGRASPELDLRGHVRLRPRLVVHHDPGSLTTRQALGPRDTSHFGGVGERKDLLAVPVVTVNVFMSRSTSPSSPLRMRSWLSEVGLSMVEGAASGSNCRCAGRPSLSAWPQAPMATRPARKVPPKSGPFDFILPPCEIA